MSQCEDCAYKKGSAANLEPNNRMRAALAALGGFVFVCHESCGWKPGMPGYPRQPDQDLSILMSRPALIAAGASAEKIREQTEATRKNLRVCQGWKTAIAKLNRMGWFTNPDIRLCRRIMAKDAARHLHELSHPGLSIEHSKKDNLQALKKAVAWFKNEAKEAKTDLKELL